MTSTPTQDARRRMKESIAQGDDANELDTWDEGLITEDRIEFINDLLAKLGENMCPHISETRLGDVEVFAFSSLGSIVCESCIPLTPPPAYINSTDCDWCEVDSLTFTEFGITLPHIALHIWANVCDGCRMRLNPPTVF